MPVVLVPGILGSSLVLRTGERPLWGDLASFYAPPETARPLARHPENDADEGISPGQVIEGITLLPGLLEIPVYRDLVAFLVLDRGYVLDTPARPGTLFLHAYNWRLDLGRCARLLQERLAAIAHRTDSPDIILAGHSHGGVIASLATRLAPPGELRVPRVRAVVTIGAAFAGAIDNWRMIVEGYRPAPLGFRFDSQICLSTLSVLETLPRPGLPVAVDTRGEDMRLDLYEPRSWARLALGPIWDLDARLARAARLHALLATPGPEPAARHVLVAGRGLPTLARAVLDEDGGRTRARFPTREAAALRWGHGVADRIFESGDGEVPESSLPPWSSPCGWEARYVHASHRHLINSPQAVAAIGDALLEAEAA